MRSIPERPISVTVSTVIAAFVAGPCLGLALGNRLAADAELAQVASTFAFPAAFLGGMMLWLGVGVARVVLGALANLLRGRLPGSDLPSASHALIPPGYGAFFALSLGLAGIAGLWVGLASATPLWLALACYLSAGAGYGSALWWLAHHGYLPFPEPN